MVDKYNLQGCHMQKFAWINLFKILILLPWNKYNKDCIAIKKREVLVKEPGSGYLPWLVALIAGEAVGWAPHPIDVIVDGCPGETAVAGRLSAKGLVDVVDKPSKSSMGFDGPVGAATPVSRSRSDAGSVEAAAEMNGFVGANVVGWWCGDAAGDTWFNSFIRCSWEQISEINKIK